ncbi:MAG: tetratricopeptide repeat protein [Firmicutes bacterium]|nr:tetratricopeptide repeat protein [Bacillota bacterium]
MPDIQRLRERAEELAENDDWGDEALSVNSQLTELDPNDVSAYNRLARVHIKREQYFKAMLIYDRVLEIDPTNRIARNGQRRCRQHLSPREDVDTAHPILASDDPESVYEIGRTAQKTEDYELAVIALERAVELCDRPSWRAALASAYRHAGELEEAAQTYCELLEYDPNNSVYRVGLAAVFRSLGELDQALEIYEDVLAQDPDNGHAHNGIAGVYMDMGRLTDAEYHFDQARSLLMSAP